MMSQLAPQVHDAGGGALYYHPHIIIRAQDADKTILRMEPLSGGAVWPAPRVRGRRISLPDIQVKDLDIFKPVIVDPKEHEAVLPIVGFRCLSGQRRDHITGVQWSQNSNTMDCGNMWQHVKISTGQTVMFWFELICLDLVRASLSAEITDSVEFIHVNLLCVCHPRPLYSTIRQNMTSTVRRNIREETIF